MSKAKVCPACGGLGVEDVAFDGPEHRHWEKCSTCRGRGTVPAPRAKGGSSDVR